MAKSPPDGYTLLLASQTNAISATLYTKLSYNPIDDFAPISLIGREPGVLVVHPSLPVKTVAELVDLRAGASPGQINYASSGNGSGQHLFAAMFASMAGIKLTHVPYRGSGQATTDLLGGVVHGRMPGTAGMLPHIKAGKLRALAVTGAHALAAIARRADAGRIGARRLFGLRVARAAGAQGHAGGDHRAPAEPRGLKPRWRRPRSRATWPTRRHRDRRLHAGRIRRLSSATNATAGRA